jgi:hypothetical protein
MDRFVANHQTNTRNRKETEDEDDPLNEDSSLCDAPKFKYLFGEFYKLVSIDGL